MIPVMGYNTINEIPLQILLPEVLERKKAGMRLSQACASYLDGHYELSYSFADDETLNYETLRVIVQLNELVPSISDMFPYAAFYENEMRELFGVNIRLIEPDYHNRFYRINAQTPFLPEDAQKLKVQMQETKPAVNVHPGHPAAGAKTAADAQDKAESTVKVKPASAAQAKAEPAVQSRSGRAE